MIIQRNYGPLRIPKQNSMLSYDTLRSGASGLIRGVESGAKYLAKEGLKEGAGTLPKLGEYAGAGLAVATGSPELAPVGAWAGKVGGKYLKRESEKLIDAI